MSELISPIVPWRHIHSTKISSANIMGNACKCQSK